LIIFLEVCVTTPRTLVRNSPVERHAWLRNRCYDGSSQYKLGLALALPSFDSHDAQPTTTILQTQSHLLSIETNIYLACFLHRGCTFQYLHMSSRWLLHCKQRRHECAKPIIRPLLLGTSAKIIALLLLFFLLLHPSKVATYLTNARSDHNAFHSTAHSPCGRWCRYRYVLFSSRTMVRSRN
jgi:hypothetical protein